MSPDYYEACRKHVEAVLAILRRASYGLRPPEPSTHFDKRMHLTLADMKLAGEPAVPRVLPLRY